MGWEDRPYYRDRPSPPIGGPIGWLLYGSVPLFTAFGIRVRAHASLIVIAALMLLVGMGRGTDVYDRAFGITALFGVILLHEFGHCFAARWTGGEANEILMTPLGGLAMAMARRRPWPQFVTVAGGPAVNVIICLVCGLALLLLGGGFPLTPGQVFRAWVRIAENDGLYSIARWPVWIYGISYALLLFNLLPIFPLDGGQLLQSILWKPMGYYKSMIVTLNVGIVGAALLILGGLGLIGILQYGMLAAVIGLNCLMNCIQMRRAMKAEGPWAFAQEDEPDYGAGGGWGGGGVAVAAPSKPKGPGWIARKRAERDAASEAEEQETVDRILAKVSAEGMASLTGAERKALKRATENQRKRDEARSAARKRSMGA